MRQRAAQLPRLAVSMAMISLSAEDPEPMHILGHDAQSDDDLAGGLGLQPESVGGRGDHLKVLQPRSAAEKEGCAPRSDRRHGRSERGG